MQPSQDVRQYLQATVVSILPYAIREKKPGLIPNEYAIPASEDVQNPQLLVIDSASFGVYAGDERTIRVSTPAIEVARAVVEDHINGTMLVELGVSEPGLFWIPVGINDPDRIKTQFRDEYHACVVKQEAWFRRLVAEADDSWSKFGQRKMISDPMKAAALRLKLNRPWLLEQEVEKALSECPACFSKINPKAIICAVCKTDLREFSAGSELFTVTK